MTCITWADICHTKWGYDDFWWSLEKNVPWPIVLDHRTLAVDGGPEEKSAMEVTGSALEKREIYYEMRL